MTFEDWLLTHIKKAGFVDPRPGRDAPSLRAFAAAVEKELGFHFDHARISRILSGQHTLTIKEAFAIAKLLGVDLEDLCTRYMKR